MAEAARGQAEANREAEARKQAFLQTLPKWEYQVKRVGEEALR